MAESLDIASIALQTLDVLVRLGRYLNLIYQDAAVGDEHIRRLKTEIAKIQDVVVSVQHMFEVELSASQGRIAGPDSTEALWRRASLSLESCLKGIQTVEVVVHATCDKGEHNTNILVNAPGNGGELDNIQQCCDQLADYERNLSILLQTIDWQRGRSLKGGDTESYLNMQEDLREITRGVQSSTKLVSEIGTIPGSNEARLEAYNQLKVSADTAAIAITAMSNEHFDIPVPVSIIYTGRQRLLKEMKEFFITPLGASLDAPQRRFVISGIGGSGKTQFCCKFAEENRDSFWGVFWIDASTTERIKQTLIHIATIAKVEHNEAAALYWLSNIKQRWLLLIDNADDPSISLERFFPVGNRGHILITTRRSAHKILGNVGPGFYDFEQLDAADANQLLLRAASKPEYSNANIVSKITKTLSFLALAIIQAGAAITKNMCTFEGYLGFYENGWKKIPRRKSLSGVEDLESPVTKVYQSWEANYDYLENNPNQVREDAIELLKVFAFLSRENIRFDILRRAVINATLEREHEQKNRDGSANASKVERIGWYRTLRALYSAGFSAGSPPPLPRLIRAGREGEDDETYVEELRCALGELVQSSLISWNELKDTYHMHPLQHRYARERLSLAEQGIWAEAAAMVLSASILLPPLGDGMQHQEFNRQMIPHLDHVRRCRTNVERDTSKMRRRLWRGWLHSPPSFTRPKAMMYGKFSFVFMQHGRWDEAEELQTQVKDFLHNLLGPVHPTSRLISTTLSTTLRHLGRPDDATAIVQEVLTVCEDYFGKHHLETLRVKSQLSDILYSRGQYSKATIIQREVVDGFVRELGPANEETLKAKDVLGRAIKWTYKPEDQNQAMQLHREAILGLETINGPNDASVLLAKESLARLLVDIGDTGGLHFNEAGILITEVIERRRRTLGKEHPYTLLAMVNAAIIRCAQNAPHEAEELLQTALDIATRNFGKDYFGTLLGRTHLGHVLVQQGRYIDAEEVLCDTTERQKHMNVRRGDYHPDRVGALIELAKCYRLQGKIDLSIETCDEAIDGFESWDLANHPLAVELRKARRKLEHHQQLVEQGQPGFDDVTEPSKGKYRPWHVF